MGKITLLPETSKEPISLMGKCSGICYDSPIDNSEKNYKRGIHNIKSGHGRVLEFVDIYMIIDGYSARVIRELYTHIGGAPTRVQASTRYIDYADKGFDYIIPFGLNGSDNLAGRESYKNLMKEINQTAYYLEHSGYLNKEDVANILPLGMTTKMVFRVNLRTLIDMSKQRLCSCAYWEFRQLMNDILNALAGYSEEWNTIVKELDLFHPKCYDLGYCNEGKRTCGRRPLEKEYKTWYEQFLKEWIASKKSTN